MLETIMKVVNGFYALEIQCNPKVESKIKPTIDAVVGIYQSFDKDGSVEVRASSSTIPYEVIIKLLKKVFSSGKIAAKFEETMQNFANHGTADAVPIRVCKISKVTSSKT